MPTLISRIFASLVLSLLLWSPCMADIGLTHQLKQEREQLLRTIASLKNDSTADTRTVDSLQQVVIILDQRIFSSYDQTVARMAAKERELSNNGKRIVYTALISTALALLLFLLLYALRKRVLQTQFKGLTDLVRQLCSDLVHANSYQQVAAKRFLRVNIVVIIGLVLMGLSILAFLIRIL